MAAHQHTRNQPPRNYQLHFVLLSLHHLSEFADDKPIRARPNQLPLLPALGSLRTAAPHQICRLVTVVL